MTTESTYFIHDLTEEEENSSSPWKKKYYSISSMSVGQCENSWVTKNKQILLKKMIKNKNKKDIWPSFPIAGSCISFQRKFYKKYGNIINDKNFSMLTLDFRLAAISSSILNDFRLLDKNLTFYFQDKKGETHSNFKKFGKNWWLRRNQAHEFMRKISGKSRISFKTKTDYLFTSLLKKIYNFT